MAQVVLLRKIMSLFQRLANARKSGGYACSASSNKRRPIFTGNCQENELINAILPIDVPRGHFAVYVGSQRSRFIVPTAYLSDPLFQALLEKAKEEYGFYHHKGITIPCEIVAFEYLTSDLGKKGSMVSNMELDEIIELI